MNDRVKILYINPVNVPNSDQRYSKMFDRILPSEIHADVTHFSSSDGLATPFIDEGPALHSSILTSVVEAAQLGYDAIVIGCSIDPALDEAKRIVPIPVMGALEGALYTAAMQFERFSVLSAGPARDVLAIRERARHYGVDHKLASVPVVEIPGPSEDELTRRFAEEPTRVEQLIVENFARALTEDGVAKGREAVEKDYAQGLVLACTVWSGMARRLQDELDVMVIDPAFPALFLAAAIARSLSTSSAEVPW
jgi:allantoin racemase